ncbi:unnamed protein product [Pleuronectes platessa]|uniref:Uncharacterized protein n=1 Tax=Pleuronectes platessa TaxID=8262 RepID=A0A9N7YSY8_PLEPL|nr:unnamed protein product [Pleuronectes platessa]
MKLRSSDLSDSQKLFIDRPQPVNGEAFEERRPFPHFHLSLEKPEGLQQQNRFFQRESGDTTRSARAVERSLTSSLNLPSVPAGPGFQPHSEEVSGRWDTEQGRSGSAT